MRKNKNELEREKFYIMFFSICFTLFFNSAHVILHFFSLRHSVVLLVLNEATIIVISAFLSLSSTSRHSFMSLSQLSRISYFKVLENSIFTFHTHIEEKKK